MQKFSWLIIFFFFFNNFSYSKEPLLVIVLMVKNEALVMQKTLQPFLDAGHQQYVILDTGSTDDTIKITRNLFKKYNISDGHIIEQPFVNFAVSRNYALECAEKIFPNAVFFLMIDAEWYVHNVEGLIAFCKKYQHHNNIAYLIRTTCTLDNLKYYSTVLFKAHQGIRYYGSVHERLNHDADIKVPDDIFIWWDATQKGNEKTFRRWHQDIAMLLKDYEEDPNNLRAMFYLGQTYACLQNFKEAIFWYGKRCQDKINDEEKYLAHMRIAYLYQLFDNVPKILSYYFNAHYIRPQRIEPLITIATCFLNIPDYMSAFLLTKYTMPIPIPHEENLIDFIDYNFTRYDILSKTAWHVGEYEIGRQATLKALDYDPFNTELQNKLRSYEDALNHKHCNSLHRKYWCEWCNGNLWMNRPAWFNFACLAHGCCSSNRCNFAQGITWRYWASPFIIPSKD